MSKREVVIIDSKIADEIVKTVKETAPRHFCGCFGEECDDCIRIGKMVKALSRKTKMIAESGELDLDSHKIYVKNI